MKKSNFIVIAFLVVTTGCASSTSLEKRADIHSKAGNYYESIGQPNAARDEYNEARKKRDHANDALPLLVELFNLFNKKEK